MAKIPLNLGMGGGGNYSEEVTATKNQVLAGYTAITSDSNDEPIEGTIPLLFARSLFAGLSDQVINSGQYLDGNQTIKGLSQENLIAENIKKGIQIKVNNGNTDVFSVTGTYTTPSVGQSPITAARVLDGYSGFVNGGNEIKGNIQSKTAQNYYVTTSEQNIPAGQYLSGAQTIKALSQTNLSAENVKKGVNVIVSNGSANIFSASGSYTTPSSNQSPIVPGAILQGFSGFVNGGSEVQGTITSQAAKTSYATTSDQTIVSSGKYCSGNITVKAISQSNLNAANIVRGKTISVNNGNTNVFSATGTGSTLKLVTGTVEATATSTGDYQNNYIQIAPGITPVYGFWYNMSWSTDLTIYDNGTNYRYGLVNSGASGPAQYYKTIGYTNTGSATRLYVRGNGTQKIQYFLWGY